MTIAAGAPIMAQMPAYKRSQILARTAEIIQERRESLAQTIAAEVVNAKMRKALVVRCGVFLCFAALLGFGQEYSQTRLAVGAVTRTPGEIVSVPVYFTPAENAQMGQVEADLVFPKSALEFTGVEISLLFKEHGGAIQASLQESPGDAGKSIVRWRVGPESKEKQIALPTGIIAYFTFQIAADAELGSRLTLKNENVVVWDLNDPPEKVSAVQSFEGAITVSSVEAPIAACFFYMH